MARQIHPMSRLLWGQLKALELMPEDLNLDGLSASTLRRRLADPDTLTLYELRLLSRRLHIPAEEIRAAIRFN